MIKTTTKKLLEVVSKSGLIVKPNSTFPIIQNLFIEVDTGKMNVTSDNLEARLLLSISVDSKESIKACVPFEVFSRLLKSIPDTDLELVFKSASLDINYPTGNYSIPRIPFEEFPTKKEIDSENLMSINGVELSEALKKTINFIDEGRMDALANGFMGISSNECAVSGFIGHSGIETKVSCSANVEIYKALFKKSSIKYIYDSLESESDITVTWDDKKMNFRSEDVDLTITLAEGKYPDYQKIFAFEKTNTLLLESSLISCLKRISSISDKDNSTVKLALSPENLSVSLDNTSYNYKGAENIKPDYNGEIMTVGFNLNFLKTAVQAYSENSIMYFQSPKKACFIEDGQSRGFVSPILFKD